MNHQGFAAREGQRVPEVDYKRIRDGLLDTR